MSQFTLSRRETLIMASGLLGAAGLTLSGCSSPTNAPTTTNSPTGTLTMTWWGPADRHRAYLAALALFADAGGRQVSATYGGFEGYFEKLQTQIAGGGAPDVMQIRGGTPPVEFIERGILLDLTQYLGKTINTADLEMSVLDSVTYKGGLYSIPQGVGSTAVYTNQSMLGSLGISLPAGNQWTWDDFASITNEIARATPDGVYGATDVWAPGEGGPAAFEVFARQRNEGLYTEEGKLGFTKDTLAEWLDFWQKLRRNGAVTPPDLTAGANSSDGTSPLITGAAPIYFSFTGILVGLQQLTEDELAPILLPNGDSGAAPGQYLEADGPLAVYANTHDPEGATKLLDFLVNDPALDELIGTVNGVPISKRRRDVLRQAAGGAEAKDMAYLDEVSAHSTALTVVPPLGAQEFESVTLQRAHEDVAFERTEISAAVDAVFSEAERLLKLA